ncbi:MULTISPECIES: N-acetyl-D-Glu racemase DgcA [unclassified Hyphomicrobium]|uniref:N-acetyl-D-Glu racemase DgcA n=1 Tax=unclassified Hyphomicrobium TaxID=2619925 RepID=UPI000213DD0D|nr:MULTISPECIES: N-acetyl-D-Glu racemase DgcA [unclassified Hyphomicrobium]CCB65131.1 L-Ala-D/L-Glu epimerase [Hyphomicrobium sp. MC1]
MSPVCMSPVRIEARHEAWPLREAFVISRGAKTAADVVVVEITDGTHRGRGEAVPYGRYGETVDGVLDAIRTAADRFSTHADLLHELKPGAALNALDCAFWDLESKQTGVPVSKRAALPEPAPKVTAFTLSLAAPEEMAAKAAGVAPLTLLKLKLGGAGDDARMRAVRQVRPDAHLVVDANEAWTAETLTSLLAVAAECGIELIEQPLPASQDGILRDTPHLVPICADESVHTADDIPHLIGLYDAVNVKLDKAGGLTGAISLVAEARRNGLKIMIGSMVGTSLAVAPAMLLAPYADWIDLDGPLLLARDREHGLRIDNGIVQPPSPELWG